MLVNGKLTNQISILDRGLQYGDGLFETIAVIAGQLSLWDQHIQRLQHGCERLGIASHSPEQLLAEAVAEIGQQQRCVLKIIITRGAGGRGYLPPEGAHSNRIIYTSTWPDYPEDAGKKGVKIRICTSRLGNNSTLAQLKHLNRLEQIMARSEWSNPAIAEGLMLDYEGRVIEGTMSNLFIHKDGNLSTPDLSRCGVAGVMRERVMDIAASSGAPVLVTDLSLENLFDADALFLTNSLIGVWPVRAIADREYDIDTMPPALAAAIGS
ncbi:Aminodeoxychorismate lyase [hydrothermal vent metagenome]|uniref:aminodeoxychorismate lyase n=1 Tax=hydrothermal vent metagenome TaxID=652676 RepID=A0A3B1BEF6_9ZZZZ